MFFGVLAYWREALMQGALYHWPDQSRAPGTDLEEELLRIRDYERKRLGQELHDSAGQLLVALQFSVRRLRAIAEGSAQNQLLEEILDTIRGIDHEIRSLAFMEFPVELGDRNLFSALGTLVSGIERRTGLHTSFKAVGEQSAVDLATSTAMLRVAQEALVNVYRHSRASVAKVVLERCSNGLYMSVSDNGIGMRDTCEGVGLQGMRHRVEALGGCFRIAHLRHGTKICASVPLAVSATGRPCPQLAYSQA
jgi:signal transduction histidine kinase